jgi:hypothetical protein
MYTVLMHLIVDVGARFTNMLRQGERYVHSQFRKDAHHPRQTQAIHNTGNPACDKNSSAEAGQCQAATGCSGGGLGLLASMSPAERTANNTHVNCSENRWLHTS